MFGFGGKARIQLPDIASVSMSECGPSRKANEDNLYADDSRFVYCVADGMGGGAEGAKASALVCREVRMMTNIAGTDYDPLVRAVQHSLSDANAVILDYAKTKGYRQMGSTAAVVVIDPATRTRASVMHVGDSRVYRIRGGLAVPLTKDHTVGFELSEFAGADAPKFRERANPLAHVLTRAIGVQRELQIDRSEIDLRPGDRLVICSDGVHDVISDARLALFAAGGTIETAKRRLSEAVLKAGAPDNFTFILIEVGDT